MLSYISGILVDLGIKSKSIDTISNIVLICVALIAILVIKFLTDKIILNIVKEIVRKNKYKIDDIFLKNKVFSRATHFIPIIVAYILIPSFSKSYQVILDHIIYIYLIIAIVLVLDSILSSINAIYNTYTTNRNRPIKAFIEVIKIIVFLVGLILIVSNLIDRSPVIILSGLGAVVAILTIVFKDSLLGFVAGIQISGNDLVRIGDWIEMPKYNADGKVKDISLNIIKVENFDQTVTTLPSYALISESFKNWRSMESSGARRIKRSIYIDISSIKFCTPKMIENYKKINLISDYIIKKQIEIEQYNNLKRLKTVDTINGRGLTNIGTFRYYIEQYIKKNSKIRHDMTQVVRQLEPSEYGLPLEIYAFANDTNWEVYEDIQSDIFDHIISIAPVFDLRLFQNPTSFNFSKTDMI